jgi:biotin carboxylase
MHNPVKDKPVAIVLGGTNPHKALIENLKTRGYYTILLDYHENPPAKEVADSHIKESTLDQEKVLAVARQKNAELVISTCVDQANVTACYVGEKLGLPIPYSYKTAFDISDKATMKELMKHGNIPTSNFICLRDNKKPDISELRFPMVVKPSDSGGSKGVRRANVKSELERYLAEALNVSRSKKAIIEEFVEGDEIGIDCFVEDGHAHVVTMHRKRKPQANDDSVIFSIGSISPPDISESAKNKIQVISNQIATVFKLNNTPLLIQAIVKGDDVKVVEFAPRIGGGLNFKKIHLFAGFNIIDATVNSFLGIRVMPVYAKPDFYYSENHIYTEPGVFGEITGYQELLDKNILVGFYPNKTWGMVIHPGKASKDRAASFIVRAKSLNDIIGKVITTLNAINVSDINGRNLNFLHNYESLCF